MVKTLQRIAKCQFENKMHKRSRLWQIDLT